MGPAVARIGRKRAFKPVDRALIILRRKRRLAGAGERHGQWIDLAIRLLSQHAARYTGEHQGKGHSNWRITHQKLHKPVSRQGYHAGVKLATKTPSVTTFNGVSSRPGRTEEQTAEHESLMQISY